MSTTPRLRRSSGATDGPQLRVRDVPTRRPRQARLRSRVIALRRLSRPCWRPVASAADTETVGSGGWYHGQRTFDPTETGRRTRSRRSRGHPPAAGSDIFCLMGTNLPLTPRAGDRRRIERVSGRQPWSGAIHSIGFPVRGAAGFQQSAATRRATDGILYLTGRAQGAGCALRERNGDGEGPVPGHGPV